MKLITSLALIIMIPTFITGVFGMNFKYMPLVEMQYGFYYLLGGMAVLSIAILLIFRLIDWL
jgi:magnesium transporter